MADDAMIIGESWLSDHFFTTDAKSESFGSELRGRHKLWKALEDAGHGSARARFRHARGQLVDALSKLAARTSDGETWPQGAVTAAELRDSLYGPLTSALGAGTGFIRERLEGPVRWIIEEGTDAAILAVVEATPAESIEDVLRRGRAQQDGAEGHPLTQPFVVDDDDSHPITVAPRLVSHLFQHSDVPFALVLAGGWALLTDRERWPEGRYLAIDLRLVLERNDQKVGGELDRATAALVFESFQSAGLENQGTPWWTTVIEASKKHSVGVSSDLREGVRLSIEDIANEVVQRRSKAGLDPLPQSEAQPLAVQALRYLYRILFLLYAEASPELEVLPVGSPEYGEGYSVDRLRDLALVELNDARSLSSTHVYESLDVLFRLVDRGHGERGDTPTQPQHDDADAVLLEGLTFNSLRADLFQPEAISLISEVGLGDGAMTRILARLLLSKEQKGRDRGFISYADLGINQLGAVYEGLMSYEGFFAEDDLYEVAKGGNAEKGSWVIPVTRADHIAEADFVTTENELTGASEKVVHRRGTFVYRLSGRARQQSASYYTPEVLTKFVVSQALEELLDQDDEVTPADEILNLTVCEPALGSGAFAIEATRQLAAEYLTRKQRELGVTIDPEDYPLELQRVKAQIALHQVYGVDLNSTAVELAEISLWLDTMVKGLDAPWFGLHLRRGNSLIGARRAVYSDGDLKKKVWLKKEPREIPATTIADDLRDDRLASATRDKVFHFLLPAEGWGAVADKKDIKDLAPEGAKALREWRKRIKKQPTPAQIKTLKNLSVRVEQLWQFVVRRLEIAEAEVRRSIPIFGRDAPEDGAHAAVTREEIERKLADTEGAYQRLRLVMNAWCAMWFWPVPIGDRTQMPPEFDEWLETLRQILGSHTEANKTQGAIDLLSSATWSALNENEYFDQAYAGAMPMDEVLREHPWLATVREVADAQGFFHWDLDFAALFANRGGFDLQVGNPPWVRPTTDVEALYAEYDPWWQLNPKATQAQKNVRRGEALSAIGMPELVADGVSDVLGTSAFVGSGTEYAELARLQPDLYRCFMVATWRHMSTWGVSSLIHPDSHFTDVKAGGLRRATYARLRRHWQFVNELQLFSEIDHHVNYGVHVYASPHKIGFLNAVNLYSPETVLGSFLHNGDGEEPGLKDPGGNWDLRPHASRVTRVDEDVLRTWRDFIGDAQVPVDETVMVYTVNSSLQRVIEKLVDQPRLGSLGLESSSGWHETGDRRAGRFDVDWGEAASWNDVILQGVHLHVANPFFKSPNETMKHNQDWTRVDLEQLAPDALPVTSYKPIRDGKYDASYTHWGDRSARDFFRFAWRNMAANTGERTLLGAIIPPGSAHIHGVTSVGSSSLRDYRKLVKVAGVLCSLVSDFQIRISPKSTIGVSSIERLADLGDEALEADLSWRSMRANAMTGAFNELSEAKVAASTWALQPWWLGARALEDAPVGQWTPEVPLRIDAERRQALLEIDAIVALSLGLTADELCTIYRTQFPVLYGYDKNKYVYDAFGREVPGDLVREWRKRGENDPEHPLNQDELVAPNAAGNETQYVLPFRTLDREAEMRAAYSYFERKLAGEHPESVPNPGAELNRIDPTLTDLNPAEVSR